MAARDKPQPMWGEVLDPDEFTVQVTAARTGKRPTTTVRLTHKTTGESLAKTDAGRFATFEAVITAITAATPRGLR